MAGTPLPIVKLVELLQIKRIGFGSILQSNIYRATDVTLLDSTGQISIEERECCCFCVWRDYFS
jgi:hypothetical protein